jgi:hypothetical protein
VEDSFGCAVARRVRPVRVREVDLHTFRRWALDGTFAGAQANADADGDIDWLVSVDSTIVRAHQHAAGAKGGSMKRIERITPSDDPEAG